MKNSKTQEYNAVMKDLYKLIKKNKLITLKEIFDFCKNGEFEKVVDICMEAFVITTKSKNQIAPGSLFNFSASFTLSGGAYPCESIPCRMSKVADLAKFSSIYSDGTTIYNPFDFVYYFLNPQGKHEMSPDYVRLEALNAFSIAIEFKSLIERGIIKFSKTIYVTCAKCKKKRDKIINSIYEELDDIAKNTLYPLLKKEIEIEYEKNAFHLRGIEPFIGEDLYIHYKKFPNFLIKKGKKVSSLQDLGFDNPLIQKITTEAIDSLVFQKIASLENLTQTYLTTSMVEKTLLEKMGQKAENRVLNFFTKGLPVIQGMPYERVIEMRDTFSTEFKSFQTHISELIGKAETFESQEEFDIYVSNELKEQLKDLKKIEVEGRKKLIAKGIAHGAMLVASIGISTITNYDLPSLLGIAQATYGCKNLLSKAEELEEEVQKSPIYFYYKLSS